jgi:hypothetical protein
MWEGTETAGRSAFMDQINGYDLNAKMVEARPQDAFLYAVVDTGWKLIWRPHMPDASELYDLRADPRETRNLYATERAQAVRLQKLLASRGGFVTAPFPSQGGGDAAAVRSALANLGYAGGASAYIDAAWAWFCPDHPEVREQELLPCRKCGAPPLVIAR